MVITLAVLLCIGAGTIGGVFFAFSTFVMKALSAQPSAHGIAAMQQINTAVLNPVFLGAFLGSALLSVVAVATSIINWPSAGALFLLASGLIYLLGSFAVTIRFNVPRNERLAKMDAGSTEAIEYWSTYVREWTWWNHVRTIASIAAAACAAGALVAT
ncbi:DUF1772 domain-containing protein [Thioalkalivibrio sp. ALE6]|uniref:anthrone oxygenase family protein n=1 Tax=Thioalkalivibrio sp. ALE6 TaxID=1266908 RepID=UPI0009DAF8A7|nr:anthrone oxygenase family protein [Thioalkalivibrio sp. ALE6]